MADTEKMKLTDLESAEVRDAFDEDGGNTAGQTNTKSIPPPGDDGPTTTTTPQSPEEAKEDVELQPLNNDGQTNNFAVYTSDVSFTTKVRLLLWKNMKIQILRRPCACFCKCIIPFLVMCILAAFTAIPDIRENVDAAYGPEFEYYLSNSGDAAQYTNSDSAPAYLPVDTDETWGDKFPWPDASVANEWMKYIVCPRNDFVGDIYDENIPSYLAIVTDQYDPSRRRLIDGALSDFFSLLEEKYGDSSEYPQEFIEEKYMDGTWSIPIYPDEDNTTAPTVEPTMGPTNEPTMEPTLEPTEGDNMTTTNQDRRRLAETTMYTTQEGDHFLAGRKLLQIQIGPYNVDYPPNPNCAYPDEDSNETFVQPIENQLFPPYPCLDKDYDLNGNDLTLRFSCWRASRQTGYLNFTEGSLLKFFSSEKELEDYVLSSKYGNPGFTFENDNEDALRPIGAAIIFEETGGDDGLTWKYKLRFNSSNVPPTTTPIDIFTKNNEEVYSYGLRYYLEQSGAINLQTWLDETIMEMIINDQYADDTDMRDAKLEELNSKTTEYSKGLFQFPSYPYEVDQYWTFVGTQFPFFLFIMFCYPIITVVSILVEEKRSKIKEGMKMMGATTSAYWTSWSIYFFMEFTLMAFYVSVVGVVFGVFRYSDFLLIFIWFWLFCVSSSAFGMLISTLFDNPKTASLCGLIMFFAILIGGQFNGSIESESGKRGLCLLSPACFVIGVDTITQYEGSTIGVTWDNYKDVYNYFTFETGLLMMFLDIILYIILTVYLDQVWPSQYGQKQSWYFFVLPSYWKKKFGKRDETEQLRIKRMASTNINNATYEQVKNQGEALIAIRELSKTFTTFGLTKSSRKEVKAVQQVSLDMYRGEVFCLLGHNGAGKTTTISMMTGLLDATDGNAWIMNNNVNDPAQMSAIRKNLGVCPQHDVLWDRLSVEEHLWLFARLKGVPKGVVQAEVSKIMGDTGLTSDGNKRKFPPQMSGGQKRKLSLGIALIGGSQIVFLDEPTSGMDPQSRRITWDLISKEKKNRCIVLTTHFMDEADILGDRVAIMGGGKVKCCGSALFLKQSYGVGYTFTVSLEANDETSKDIDNLKKKVDGLVFETISGAQDVALAGSELTYRLPFEETGSFSKVFDKLDENKDELFIKSYGISVTTLEEVFLKIGHDEIDDEADYGKDKGQKNEIRMDETAKREAQDQFKQPTVSTFALQEQNAFQIFFIHVYAVLYKRFWWSIRDFRALFCSLFCPVILSGMALGLLGIQIATNEPEISLSTVPGFYDVVGDVKINTPNNYTLNESETYYMIPNNFYMDNKSFYQTYVDSLQGENGEMVLVDIDIDPSEYYRISPGLISECVALDEEASNPEAGIFVCGEYKTTDGPDFPIYEGITYDFQDYLLDEASADDPFYNAFVFYPYSMTSNSQRRVYFGVNGSALHGLPITTNLWNNWIINDIVDSKVTIEASMEPLPVTERQDLVSSQISGFIASIYLVIAFSFIPAAAIYFMVNEKSNLTKHQQLVSGISFIAYWVSNYLADICIGLPASILVFLSVYVFDAESFQGDAAGPFFGTLVMFLISSLPFTYLLSFIFSSPAKAQMGTILLYIIFGMILGLASFILDSVESTADTNEDLKPLYRFFPVFLMAESLFNISLKQLVAPDKDYNHWDVCGRNYFLMFIEGVGYFCLVLLLEYLLTFPVVLQKLGFVTNTPLTETEDELDPDVLAEKKRIEKGIKVDENGNVAIDKSVVDDTVVIAGLRKVYNPAGSGGCFGRTLCSKTEQPGACGRTQMCAKIEDADKIEAVKNLYFGVKQSEVFGYLGVNGAGKTTTLATLTGERYPSSGTAFIANFPISKQLDCRRYVGYCPQFDAIFDLLTAAEHLKFYAMIKGLKGDEADEQVKVLLNALTLNKYKNRTAGTYSGGNKRKLSVAVSMIGNPPVIFLDEPSTGMDPVSRRHMWEFISTTMAGRCVILTTHSMEECEALCNRVGIMVAGQLKCIGTAQHLKSRYGKGYQLDITLTQECTNNDDEKEKEQQIETLQNELAKNFGAITLIEHNGSRISYELVKNEDQLKLGAMFNILEEMKTSETFKRIIQAYALSQTTLEQIFIRMAKEGKGGPTKEPVVIMDPDL